MDDRVREGAAALVATHGAGAIQHLIDQMVIAVRAQDEAAITLLDQQLRAVDALIQEQANRRRYGSDWHAA